MQRYSDSVILSGRGSLQAMAGALVYVYLAGTTTLATIYSDDGVTELDNPLTAGDDGEYSFFAADGSYDLQAVIGSKTDTKRGVVLFDSTQTSVTDVVSVTASGGDDTDAVRDAVAAVVQRGGGVVYTASPNKFFFVANGSDYADDAAAAAGGIVVGQVYRTGSALKVRVA